MSALGPSEIELLRSGVRIMAARALGDTSSAEEVAQETLARAVVAIGEGRLADPARLGAFVAGIARHVIADMKRDARRVVPLDVLPEAATHTNPDPLAALVSAGERERVRAAMASLSRADRELIRLSFYEGLAPAELAERLGVPGERVRKRKSRALERLRRAFLGEAVERHDLPRGATEEGGPGVA